MSYPELKTYTSMQRPYQDYSIITTWEPNSQQRNNMIFRTWTDVHQQQHPTSRACNANSIINANVSKSSYRLRDTNFPIPKIPITNAPPQESISPTTSQQPDDEPRHDPIHSRQITIEVNHRFISDELYGFISDAPHLIQPLKPDKTHPCHNLENSDHEDTDSDNEEDMTQSLTFLQLDQVK